MAYRTQRTMPSAASKEKYVTATVAPRRPHPWWVGFVSGMASYIDAAAIISFGIALVIYQHAIGLDGTQVGIASGALTFGIAIGALVGGNLGDRFGRRPVFSVTMVLIALGATALTLSTAFPLILAGAVCVGLGTGADLPVSLSTISEAATDANRGKLIGFSQILWFIGILVAIGLGIFFGNAGRSGGQIMFGHLAVVSTLILLARLTIPESDVWLAARDARSSGRATAAESGALSELLKAPYLAPFVALMVFYAMINLSANTLGQFGTYLLVNAAGVDVSTASALGLPFIPLGILGTIWFMAIADGKRRFTYFTVGAVLTVVGNLIPVFVPYSVPVYLASNFVALGGAAFAGEALMKVWTQESFPTLLRTTAQGSVIAVARLLAALLAGLTPLLIAAGVSVLYGVLSALCAVGVITAWTVFRKRIGHTEFAAAEPAPEGEVSPALG